MTIKTILQDYLSQPKLELGNRTEYVGASDVAQCPRKVVLTKTQPVAADLPTLTRYERGNMVDRIVDNALEHAEVPSDKQVEVIHPEYEYLMAHLDFVFARHNEVALLEAKSVSRMPDTPYTSWIEQIHFQMGLLALSDSRKVRGAILAVDLSSGQFRLSDDFSRSKYLFRDLKGRLMEPDHIRNYVRHEK